MALVLVIGSKAYANDNSQLVRSLHAQRAQIEAQLGIDQKYDTYPHATCYYDDLEHHYELEQLTRDLMDV